MNTTLHAPASAHSTTGKPPTHDLPSNTSQHPDVTSLPKVTRDMINVMLDDALPYRVIIDELAESGSGLTTESLVKWLGTGHRDHVKQTEVIDRARTSAEFAADLVRELGQVEPVTILRACLTVATLQILEAIQEHGAESLQQMLREKPQTYISLLNLVCNITAISLNQTVG